ADLAGGEVLGVEHLVEGLDAHPQERRRGFDVQDVQLLAHRFPPAVAQRLSISSLTNRAISSVGVPGPKSRAKPSFSRRSMSSPGMIPPPIRRTSPRPRLASSSLTRGNSVMCAPERIESPTTLTSSCCAASAIISGV